MKQGFRLRLLSLVLFMAFSLTAAAVQSNWGSKEVKVGKSVELTMDAAIMGTTRLSTVTVTSWQWVSNNTSIARVKSSVLYGCTVEGVSPGSTRVYCNLKYTVAGTYYSPSYSIEGYFTIKVTESQTNVLVTSVSLNVTSITMTVGDTEQLSANVSPNNATDKSVSWSSSNTSVATVSSSGLVTAKSAGSATITCKANDGSGVQATCTVTVSAPDPIKVTDIWLNNTTASLSVGETMQLSATVSPSNATDNSVNWSSSNSSVVSVSSSGLVTAIAAGSATITCKANDGSGVQAICSITVTPSTPTGYFTAKTVEGVNMTFNAHSDHTTCEVSSNCIDKGTTGKITIPEEVEGLKVISINDYAFSECAGITSVSIPSSVERIGYFAFSDCTGLTSVALGNGVKEIDGMAFFGCSSLATITGINKLENIGDSYVFRMYEYDTYIPWYNSLPDGLLYLGKVLYKYKGTMPDNTSVNILEGTTQIGSECFSDCNGLVEVNIPQSVLGISEDAFMRCWNLSSINIASGNTKYDSRNNCNAIVETATNTIIAGCKNSTFPSSVTAIGAYAFKECGLTELVIPNNIDSIAGSAFAFNSTLTSITIGRGARVLGAGSNPFLRNSNLRSISIVSANPYYESPDNCNAIIEKSTDRLITGCASTLIPPSVRVIGQYAFASAKNNYVIIPDRVEKIERDAFLYNSLSSVVIGRNVKEIESNAFGSCSKLKAVYSFAPEPSDIDETAFSILYGDNKNAIYDSADLYVPTGSKINYMTTIGWNKFKNIVEFDPSTFDPTVLSVHGVKAADTDRHVYDLNGRRLMHPKKGINIIGGKKVLAK